MPAFRAPLPQALSDCLRQNPQGCQWDTFKPYFVNSSQNSGDGQASLHLAQWGTNCQMTNQQLQNLAPSAYTLTSQINQPLGLARATTMAQALNIQKNMILTPEEYQCMIGSDPLKRTSAQQTIYQCIYNLTNTEGNSGHETPLASYGLNITTNRLVQSVCAPASPCLDFNQLFVGPLQEIATQCGFEDKLHSLVSNTSFSEIITQAQQCQSNSQTGCFVVTE